VLNIHRIDHDGSRTHCWRVIVQRRRRSYGRSFSDRRYGGSQAALVAAKGYRDEVIRSNPALSKPVYCAILKKTNRSGVSGLSRVDRWALCHGRRIRRLYWEAQWPIAPCRSRHRKFSILKYGEDGAYQRALKAREIGLDALATQTFSPFASRVVNEAAA